MRPPSVLSEAVSFWRRRKHHTGCNAAATIPAPAPGLSFLVLLLLKHCHVVQLLALSIRTSRCDRASFAVLRNHVPGHIEGFALELGRDLVRIVVNLFVRDGICGV